MSSGGNPHHPPYGASHNAILAERQRQARLARIRQHRQQLMAELQQRKAEYVSTYDLPLDYPAKVVAAGANREDDAQSKGGNGESPRLRTSPDFINARLLEAGVPLGRLPSSASTDASTSSSSPSSSLAEHGMSVERFIKDLEGTGCYDSVQVHIGPSTKSNADAENGEDQTSMQQYDATVHLREKKWYKLYIGGGVNSEDLSSLGSATGGGSAFGGGGAAGAALSVLPKLQFETSASLLNLTGFADVSSASYSVDQTGSTSFRFVHDRPLCSYFAKGSGLYSYLMPEDPRNLNAQSGEDDNSSDAAALEEDEIYAMDDAQYALGGGSHATLGVHATFHDVDHEHTRSSNEFVRSLGVRLANHARGAARGTFGMSNARGANKPSISPPESMAGPYLFLDWSASLRDVLPKRLGASPFALDCSPEIARRAGTYLKHSMTAGLYLNGCFVDDRYDPTMGYDAHLVGEVAGPPGDVGFFKVKGGCAWHLPISLLGAMMLGVRDNEYSGEYVNSNEDVDSPTVIGTSLHSSFNCGILHPLTFNGLLQCDSSSIVPVSERFFIGGPGQLRGFLPAGIGPRASGGGSSVPGGDALGGDLFYTASVATSVPFPTYFSTLRQNGARVFGFANAGTCVSMSNGLIHGGIFNQILQSSRVAIGGGVSVPSPMGRFETTYAIPIRYGPRDARRAVQFGFGFSFG
mmetsp:Transcript_28158/g.59464  ORF Transcript_28158/g.59464 Transcript_28158/m.59464 type:complete len:693 (+) Transcript_28158:43-2121(+)